MSSSSHRVSKPRKPRKSLVLPAPQWSAHLYVNIDPSQVHMFRYLLEAQDNLGIMSVIDRWGASLMIRFSPHQEREILEFLHGMQQTVPFSLVPCKTADTPAFQHK